jgi:hypothetical protein
MAECRKFGDWEKAGRWFGGLAERLLKEMEKATKVNAMLVVKEIKRRIRAKEYAPNSALTVALKGSSTPLVDNADLFRSIEAHTIDSLRQFAGVLRGTRSKDGEDLVNIAKILHDGIMIKMTPAMRRWIFAQLRDAGVEDDKSAGKNKKPGWVVIPGRPFIKAVFDDPKVKAMVKANWEQAVKRVLEAD